jgi:hypothetical protein
MCDRAGEPCDARVALCGVALCGVFCGVALCGVAVCGVAVCKGYCALYAKWPSIVFSVIGKVNAALSELNRIE